MKKGRNKKLWQFSNLAELGYVQALRKCFAGLALCAQPRSAQRPNI
jgi:hypothetical protein